VQIDYSEWEELVQKTEWQWKQHERAAQGELADLDEDRQSQR
jgi:hypothetical protein